jgi:hypothetical protein
MTNLPVYQELYDKINSYYLTGYKLSEKDKEIAERWELSFALLSEHRSRKVAVNKLIAVSEKKGKQMSVAQAYRDMANAERIFAPLKQYSKEFLRLVIIESAIRDIKECDRKSKKEISIRDWGILKGIKDKAENRIIEVSGLKDVDVDTPDFEKLIPSDYNIVLPDGLTDMFKRVIQKGVVDVTSVMQQQQAEDVDFEES